MRSIPNFAATLAVTLLVVWSASSPATAQTEMAKKAVAKVENALTKVANACTADLRAFCGTVTPGDGRLALCLIAHEDKVGGACFEAMMDVALDIELAANRIWRAADLCRPDIAKLCGGVRDGQGRVAQCLVNNKAKLGPLCRNEVALIESKLKR